uniref:NADH-ubiquinone oxidoreductase chain 6 n=1 Tax=Scaptodera rhadamistus TaxID=1848584 RepID=A0A1X9HDY4_9SCAR|nr:NADH deshydrogenase subunit 6 [Scaptodera rhadamistus]
MLMIIFMLMASLLMIWVKHPLSMGLTLLIQTINLSLYLGFFNLNYWFSYILFLIMVGSMLILFIYMTSIASNEKFKFSINMLILNSITFIMILFMYLYINPFYMNLNNKMEKIEMKFKFTLIKFINFPNYFMYYILIIYLLITLMIIVQITYFNKMGALRSSHKFNN